MTRWAAPLALTLALLQGCASTQMAQGGDPRDPWEGMNRRVYAFNDRLDEAVLAPVARGYAAVVPKPVRTGFRNVLGNVGDVWTGLNAALQFKGQVAAESFMRVAINTTLGLYGLLDIASEAGLEKRKEDFGQTLGHWGVKPGPYVVLPVLGPSTLRDSAALPADMTAQPSRHISSDAGTQTGVTVVGALETRAGLLQASGALKAAAIDPYSFVRDAWLQKRQNNVYDGNPPQDFDYADPDAPEPAPAAKR